MINVLYVLSMAYAFTYKINGSVADYWLKYIIATFWILLFVMSILANKNKNKKDSLFLSQLYIVPILFILIWTILMFIFNRQGVMNSSYVSRSISNLLCLLLAQLSAVASASLLKKDVIKLTLYSIILSSFVNVFYAINVYGLDTFFQFLKEAWMVTDFDPTRKTYAISQMLEVHDSTIACGFFLIYYLFFCDNRSERHRPLYIVILLFISYIGFKRIMFFGLLVVFFVMRLINKKNISIKTLSSFFAIFTIVISIIYVVFIKTGILFDLANKFNIDFSGRFIIYDLLKEFITKTSMVFGTGYGYINKYFEDRMGLASHCDLVRMFIELGLLPFCIWIIYYFKIMPKKLANHFGEISSKIALTNTIYIFVIYLVGNAMNFYCIQFCYVIIPVALFYSRRKESNEEKKDINIINAKSN